MLRRRSDAASSFCRCEGSSRGSEAGGAWKSEVPRKSSWAPLDERSLTEMTATPRGISRSLNASSYSGAFRMDNR